MHVLRLTLDVRTKDVPAAARELLGKASQEEWAIAVKLAMEILLLAEAVDRETTVLSVPTAMVNRIRVK